VTCPPVWSISTGAVGVAHIVLIHGSLDRSAGLLKLSRRLHDRFHVTRYDRRGYGRSTPCAGPFGLDAQIDDLIDVLAPGRTGWQPVIVVGHSYGGNVGLALADRRPDLVAGVVTYESPLSWESWWPGKSAGGDALAWVDDPAQAAEQFMRHLIGDERWEHLSPGTREARRSEGSAMVGELVDLRTRPAWDPARIKVPVLAVHGQLGLAHHQRAMEALGKRVGDVEVAVIAGARHFGPNTHPNEMADLVIDFIDRRVAGRVTGRVGHHR
jgi:pimeloyl-ACP methyl ester carboxylesterase